MKKVNIQTVLKEIRRDERMEDGDLSISSPSPTREYDSSNPQYNFSM